jgi:ABC-2 type transport system permease protein
MFNIFIGQQIELWRNKGALFFIVLFPMLLVFILGTMLSNLDYPDEPVVRFSLAYVIESDDPATRRAAEVIVEQFADVEQIGLVQRDDLPTARQELREEKLGSVVVFREPFAIEILEGASVTQNRVVRTIFEGISRLYGTVSVVKATFAPDDTSAVLGGDASGGQSALLSIATSGSAGMTRVEEASYGVSRSMIDYYAVTMIVMMFLMSSATVAASLIFQMRKDGTLRRLLVSPLGKTAIYLQFLTGSIPMNLLQVGIVMVAAPLFLGAHYAATWQLDLLLFAMLFVAGFAFSAIFLVLGIFIRFNPWILLMPLMWMLLFLSGSFSKEIYVPGLSELMPPRIIQNAAFELTLFGHTQPALNVLFVSLGLIALATVVGSALFNRRQVVM